MRLKDLSLSQRLAAGCGCVGVLVVLVTLLGEDKLPRAAWLFMKAWPVKWSTSDLNASDAALVIDTMELAYTRMQILRV